MTQSAEKLDVVKLHEGALPQLESRGMQVPKYTRRSLKRSWVHIGVGGFHRAHQARYADDLAQGGTLDWGIVGAGLLPQDASMKTALESQDYLFALTEKGSKTTSSRIIGSIVDFIHAPSESERLLATLASADVKLVTLTITEGGYNIDETGRFDLTNATVRADLETPKNPKTAFGYLVEAIARRRAAGIAPFTILSCDNLQGNGEVARNAIVSFARARSAELATYIDSSVAFPNSMVDRITPMTSDADRSFLLERYGVQDAWPVGCEPFIQWVIEDHFSAERPNFESVGAQIVPDVRPYETMKLRLLNASHSAMGYLGYLCGYRRIDDVARDEDFGVYVRGMMDQEVTPHLPAVPGIDLQNYKKTLMERFSNPSIGDQVLRICLNGSAKMPKFIVPSIEDALKNGAPMGRLCLCVAAWARFLTGTDEQGSVIPIEDPMSAQLVELATRGGQDPRPLLGYAPVFGALASNGRFVTEVESALRLLYTSGSRATLQKYR